MTRRYELIGVDADDTLWHSEDAFHDVERRYVELLTPFVADGVDVRGALRATEQRHLPISGYGVKAFTLSLVECAITVSQGAVPATVIGEALALGMAAQDHCSENRHCHGQNRSSCTHSGLPRRV